MGGFSIYSNLYEHANFSGRSQSYGLAHGLRYHLTRGSDLSNVNLLYKISSADLRHSSSKDVSLILFDDNYWGFFTDFTGSFLQMASRVSSESSVTINNLANHGFNDRTGSLLLVARNKVNQYDFRYSFRDMIYETWIDKIDEELKDSKAKRKGEPSLTWELWPLNTSYLDRYHRYLKIHQPLKIVLDWWPDYYASITYHLYLYLDNAGKVRGYVARWAYWVEDGSKSSEIAGQLEPKVISGMNTINQELSTKFNDLDQELSNTFGSNYKFRELYYLPGRQLSFDPGEIVKGSTFEDITIVVVLGD